MVLAAVAVPAVALAVATPVTPTPGSVVASEHPRFSWMLPSNERSDALFISRRGATQAGHFRDVDLVDAAYFKRNDVDQYTPARALYAGRYWWLVETSDLTTYKVAYSAPLDFRIPARTSLLGVGLERHSSEMVIDVRWTTNTRELTVRERISRGNKTLFTSSERRTLPPVGGVRHTAFDWKRPQSVHPGVLVKLEVTVAGIGHAESTVRYFRAPG